MATLVYVDRSARDGARVLNALQLLKQGIGELYALDGTRAQAIGTSQAAMQAVFGTDTASSAQALSDRMSAWLAAQASLSTLHDLIDATIDGDPPA